MSVLALSNVKTYKFFGEPSSNSNSVTESFPLADGNYANIMVLRIHQANGKISPLSLPVNHLVKTSYSTVFNLKKDKVIQSAKNWLLSLPACKNKKTV